MPVDLRFWQNVSVCRILLLVLFVFLEQGEGAQHFGWMLLVLLLREFMLLFFSNRQIARGDLLSLRLSPNAFFLRKSLIDNFAEVFVVWFRCTLQLRIVRHCLFMECQLLFFGRVDFFKLLELFCIIIWRWLNRLLRLGNFGEIELVFFPGFDLAGDSVVVASILHF